jgi:phage-related protein
MAVEIATAYINLQPSARGFQRAIGREIGSDLRKAGERAGDDTSRSFGTRFKKGMQGHGRQAALALGAAFTGAAILGKSAVDAASALEETQSKVNTVFGEGADEINAWAKTAARSLGQSEQQALDAAGSFGNLFTQLGIGTDTAADMSKEMVGLATDFASFHNADITEVIEAQSAAFRGEYDALQRFVPTINAAAVEQKAMEMGLAATTKELDQQDKALATQALMLEGAGQAAGDFERTSGGLANQQRIMSAQFKDLQASLGQALIPAMSLAVEVAMKLFDGFSAVGGFLADHKEVLIGAIAGITIGLGAFAVSSIAAAAAAGTLSFGLLGVAAPFIAIGVAAAAVVAGLVYAYKNFEWFRKGVDKVVDVLVAVGKFFRDSWKKYADDVARVFMTIAGVASDVFGAIKDTVRTAIGVISQVIDTGVATIKGIWRTLDGIFHFFRDSVVAPILRRAGEFRDLVAGIVTDVVDKVKTAWSGIRAIVDFFRDSVYDPVMRRVNQLRDAIGTAFEKAVSAVRTAWDTLKSVVKVPINVVIGFYNDGIRKLWNNIISKIPGIGDLPEVAKFARGGWVPGTGNKDTVPAVLTPGEYVITKKAAQKWGPGVLEALNKPNGTIDPGIFGYQTGGYVRSADEALEWARQQHGKPYRFPLVGPNAYDCSGFTSALINYILGRNPHSRRHSSGSMSADPALSRGAGTNPNGALFGARPPYMTNAQGARVGHTTATLMGVNMEATPPAVRVGGNARGARSLTQLFHLAGYGGLSDADQNVVASTAVMSQARVASDGGFFSDILTKLVNKLPGMIYDFFMKKLPEIVVRAIKNVVSTIADTLNPFGSGIDYAEVVRRLQTDGSIDGFADGGTVRRNGPILVGERGPEVLWGRRGMQVTPNHELGAAAKGDIIINNNHAPFDLDRAMRQARLYA